MQGWIKLHRKLADSSIFDNAELLRVWVWCLLKATHKGYKQLVGFQEIELLEGQFITGRFKGSTELKINPSTFYKYLKLLEKMQMIELKSNNKMTVVTVANWGKYQGEENETYQQKNNDVTTKEQQSNTNKNVKNNKEETYSANFEELWKLYPNKKSKTSVSKKAKEDIYKVGTEKMIQAINSYKKELSIETWKHPMNGSTFFNGRYEDYLSTEDVKKLPVKPLEIIYRDEI